MNQKLSLSLFFSGLATFLMSLGELLSSHENWSSLSAPSEVGHIILITASFCMTVAGALGVNLPRKKNSRVSDRLSSEEIVNTIIQEEKNDK